ncbi:MAG: hypothetical protein NZ960_02390 [Candidatus Kapabacteria bacterium]|nr:hypothetical protein [Candidatus Kapabacteria bacterium]MDW8011872.1 hypothetical protein [Bacteroidota bacterium]
MSWRVLVVVGLAGCGLLSPRTPQPPEYGGAQEYQQPTTPAAVVENFQHAVARQDVVAFLRCLLDSTEAPGRSYRFEPSGQALARYGAVFAHWDREAERQSFLGMVSRVLPGAAPELILIAPVFELQTPDSAVFRAEYRLSVPHREPGVPGTARGMLRWTLVPLPNGFWVIQRWTDLDAADTAAISWSVFKALWRL